MTCGKKHGFVVGCPAEAPYMCATACGCEKGTIFAVKSDILGHAPPAGTGVNQCDNCCMKDCPRAYTTVTKATRYGTNTYRTHSQNPDGTPIYLPNNGASAYGPYAESNYYYHNDGDPWTGFSKTVPTGMDLRAEPVPPEGLAFDHETAGAPNMHHNAFKLKTSYALTPGGQSAVFPPGCTVPVGARPHPTPVQPPELS